MLAEDVCYCPRCGTQLSLQERMGRTRPVCPNCDWVFFPDPKVAAAVLVQEAGKILLVQRANNPKRGLWTLPVGFVDAGEDPVRAAERECLEETGLQVRVVKLLDVLYGQEHPRGAHIIIVYQGERVGGELIAGDDAGDAGFYAKDSLPALAFHTTHQIIDRYFQAGSW